ncbi:CobW family GTP-binding protein [Pseudactinotalea sp.]|uniref:CobW family GTP-binding protein n=1 Tax=Pseudactinotalea sp. TaxID=1926260 RepID=UPI003B3B030C
MDQIPVVALTGRLGAGKTTLLNHVLRASDARLGVVVNDFGAIDVDAALLFGQVDEPAAISGGCLCCIEDDSELDLALERLAAPALALDAIVVEASGMADPLALARMIRFSGAERVRPGGLVDVVDAVALERSDTDPVTLSRFRAATLVVVNKLDGVADPDATLALVAEQARSVRPQVQVVGARGGAIDPALLVDAAEREQDELPWRELLRPAGEYQHEHADAVTVAYDGEVDPGPLVDLLESPPEGAYRLKGTVAVRWRSGVRVYAVNAVGGAVHVARARAGTRATGLVAIGMHLEEPVVRTQLEAALTPPASAARAADMKRLDRLVRLSV